MSSILDKIAERENQEEPVIKVNDAVIYNSHTKHGLVHVIGKYVDTMFKDAHGFSLRNGFINR